jgi:hypothetical protein
VWPDQIGDSRGDARLSSDGRNAHGLPAPVRWGPVPEERGMPRVLVVDDDPGVVAALTEGLTLKGIR